MSLKDEFELTGNFNLVDLMILENNFCKYF